MLALRDGLAVILSHPCHVLLEQEDWALSVCLEVRTTVRTPAEE